MSRDKLQLYLTADELHGLTVAEDRTRAKAKTVREIDRTALIHILMDYGALIRRLNECGVETIEPKEPKAEPRARVEHVAGEPNRFRVVVEEAADDEVTQQLVTEAHSEAE